MTTFRDIKRNARRDRHTEMAVPALFYPFLGDLLPTPVDCSVRLWLRTDQMTGSQTVERGSAELAVPEDRIRIDLAEIARAKRGGVFSIETGEAYRIDHLYEADDEFQTARVVRLSAAEADTLAVPE